MSQSFMKVLVDLGIEMLRVPKIGTWVEKFFSHQLSTLVVVTHTPAFPVFLL